MGRIRRIGYDTVTNYEFAATSAYDANNPPGTIGGSIDDAAMDQPLTLVAPDEVSEQGILVTFDRFPDFYQGAVVKLKATYNPDTDGPTLEQWTHDSVTTLWTKRSAVALNNPFTGVETARRRIFDLRLAELLTDVDMVWITLNPGGVGSPTVDYDALHLFGFCNQLNPETPNPPPITGPTGDPCLDDPDHCLDCPPNTAPTVFCQPAVPLPPVDVCDPASITAYLQALALYGAQADVDAFNAWLADNAAAIASACAGTFVPIPSPPTIDPPAPLPPLPVLDLCDPDSVTAYRAALEATPDALAYFDAMIQALTDVGFFDLCDPPAPAEVYVDPVTLAPAAQPPSVGAPICDPFFRVAHRVFAFQSLNPNPGPVTMATRDYVRVVFGQLYDRAGTSLVAALSYQQALDYFLQRYGETITLPAVLPSQQSTPSYLNVQAPGENAYYFAVRVENRLGTNMVGNVVAVRIVATRDADGHALLWGPAETDVYALTGALACGTPAGQFVTSTPPAAVGFANEHKYTGALSTLMQQLSGSGAYYVTSTGLIPFNEQIAAAFFPFQNAGNVVAELGLHGIYVFKSGFTYAVTVDVYVPTANCVVDPALMGVDVFCELNNSGSGALTQRDTLCYP